MKMAEERKVENKDFERRNKRREEGKTPAVLFC